MPSVTSQMADIHNCVFSGNLSSERGRKLTFLVYGLQTMFLIEKVGYIKREKNYWPFNPPASVSLRALTAGRVDDVTQLGVLPLAQVVLFHTGSGFGRLHLRTPMERNRRAWVRRSA